MKLLDVILLSVAVAMFMIGIHQSTVHGIKNSYWIFMISLVCILVLRYRRAIAKIDTTTVVPTTPQVAPTKTKKKKKNA